MVDEKITLTEAQMEWVEKAVEQEFTPVQVKKKLMDGGYSLDYVLAMLEYYEEYQKELIEITTASKKKKTKVAEKKELREEKDFEKKVKDFSKGKTEKLSFSERRAIKRFIKNITAYNKVLESSLKAIKQEIDTIGKKYNDYEKVEKEMRILKKDLIDRIIDSKEVLRIDHPETGEDVTKENLQSLELDDLIKLMEENIEALQMVVNGKVE